MRLLPTPAWLAALLALAAPAPGQTPDDGRDVLVGSAVGLDGKPWAAARVTLFAPAIEGPDLPALFVPQAADAIEATCDERGRFRARVLRGRAYALVAAAGDPPRATDVAHASSVTRTVRLVEAREQPLYKRVVVVGAETWKDIGPVDLRYIDGLGRHSVLPGAAAEPWALPWTSGKYGGIEARLDGVLIAQHFVSLAPASAADAADLAEARQRNIGLKPWPGLPDLARDELPADVERAVIGPPVRVMVRVLDAATRQPIAGATVGYRLGKTNLALTGRDGTCEVRMPLVVNSWGRGQRIDLFARSPRHAARGFAWTREPMHDFDHPLDDALDGLVEIDLPLEAGASLRGRVRGTKQVAPDRVAIRWMAYVPNEIAGRSSGGTGHPEWLTPEADGTWTLPGVPSSPHRTYTFSLSQETLGRLAPDRQPPSSPGAFPREIPRKTETDVDAGVFDLATIRFADLHLTLPDGQPAGDADIVWRPLAGENLMDGSTHARCDRRGRARIAFADPTALTALTDEHFAALEIEPGKLLTEQSVTLQPLLRARGRVVDLDGRPVEGADVFVRTRRAEGPAAALARHVGKRNEMLVRATTDAGGRFEVRFMTLTGLRFVLGASKHLDRSSVGCEEPQVWLRDAPADDIEIVLSFRQGKTVGEARK